MTFLWSRVILKLRISLTLIRFTDEKFWNKFFIGKAILDIWDVLIEDLYSGALLLLYILKTTSLRSAVRQRYNEEKTLARSIPTGIKPSVNHILFWEIYSYMQMLRSRKIFLVQLRREVVLHLTSCVQEYSSRKCRQ